MENTMNFRGITRYSFDTTRPTLFRRVIDFFKAALAVKKSNAHDLSDAMSARLYL